MTREEAIKFGKRVLSLSLFDETHEFCELAVKALEQQPCEDTISRSEAIRIASGYCHWSNIPAELAKLPSVNPIPCEDAISRQAVLDMIDNAQIITDGEFRGYCTEDIDINILPSVSTEKTGRWIPVSDKYEYHIDHTDCLWYGNDSGCPCTCSQYRDGWNDAMNYIFKDGKGYQPYRRDTDG